MAEDDEESEGDDDCSDSDDESDDSFIDNDEVVCKTTDFLDAKLLEVENNKKKILNFITGLPKNQFEKLGLTFSYSTMTDL